MIPNNPFLKAPNSFDAILGRQTTLVSIGVGGA